jgi:hypothetical protein
LLAAIVLEPRQSKLLGRSFVEREIGAAFRFNRRRRAAAPSRPFLKFSLQEALAKGVYRKGAASLNGYAVSVILF